MDADFLTKLLTIDNKDIKHGIQLVQKNLIQWVLNFIVIQIDVY